MLILVTYIHENLNLCRVRQLFPVVRLVVSS